MLRDTLSTKAFTARTLAAAGILAPERPDRLALALAALARWGATAAGAYAAAAIRYPDAVAIVDERRSLTFEELQRRTNALARAWSEAGIAQRDRVAILCRNHSGPIEAMTACSKLGADALLLNTAFAGPQLADVIAREQPSAIVYDEEFSALIGDSASAIERFAAWTEDAGEGVPRLDELVEAGDGSELEPPAAKGRVVILTSGTTGVPRGAIPRQPDSLDPLAALLSKIPLRARERTLIAAPLFESSGLAHLVLALGLSSTLVLRRHFDPGQTLDAIDEHGVTAMVVVPAMLERMLELGKKAIGRHDLGALRVIAASGAALPDDLATRVMDVFGDVLYNVYGSSAVSWATVATPQDLREAPATAGRPPRGTVVRLYDEQDRELTAAGEAGRIFVGSDRAFEGGPEDAGRRSLDGLVCTGDIGHHDAAGRLFIDGREDEMIASGADSGFPREIEQ